MDNVAEVPQGLKRVAGGGVRGGVKAWISGMRSHGVGREGAGVPCVRVGRLGGVGWSNVLR